MDAAGPTLLWDPGPSHGVGTLWGCVPSQACPLIWQGPQAKNGFYACNWLKNNQSKNNILRHENYVKVKCQNPKIKFCWLTATLTHMMSAVAFATTPGWAHGAKHSCTWAF